MFSVLPNAQLAARLCSAYNDWLLDNWLQPEPRLRGMIVVPAQWPEAAAREIRRVGGRDEFVGVFLPGRRSRIPYGNPVYDPIWEAANDLGLPVAVHTHYESIGIAGPITAAGMPDFYCRVPHALRFRDVRTLRLDPLPRNLRALPRYAGRNGRGRARSVRRIPLAPRHELESRAAPRSPGAAGVPRTTSGITSASRRSRSRRPTTRRSCCRRSSSSAPAETLMYASDFPHWDFDEPEQTLRQLPDAWRDNVRWRNAAGLLPAARARSRTVVSARRARGARSTRDAPPEGRRADASRSTATASASIASARRFYALADRCPHRGAPLCAGAVATAVELHDGERRPRHAERHRSLSVAQVGVRHRHRLRPRQTSGCACAATHVQVRNDEVVVSLDRKRET